jgi:hypothetical protein
MATNKIALSDSLRDFAKYCGLAMADTDLDSILNPGGDGEAASGGDDEDSRIKGSALPTFSPGTDGKTPVPTKEDKPEDKKPEEPKASPFEPKAGGEGPEEIKKDLEDLEKSLEGADDKKKAGQYKAQIEEFIKALGEIKSFVSEKKSAAPEAGKEPAQSTKI